MTLGNTPTLSFDEATHTYRIGGRVVPSVTQVIGAVLPGWQASQWHLERGSAVHLACRYLDEGRLDWSTVDDQIIGRVRAWQRFRESFPAKVVACEHSMATPAYQFAGTVDRVLEHQDSTRVIADLKSSLTAQVRLQLAAYAILWGKRVDKAVGVELRDDGTFATLWMDEREINLCKRTFLAALSVYGFAATHKLIKENRRD